ncbi:GMC oxidoreductase [Streptomyces sp. T-3]|nr:GMC oxidoreductase [Streptomyces sp. T-3]
MAIIGAGLGGAITAYRLARAGVPSVVLERGRRWPITPAGDTFPSLLPPDIRSVWMGCKPWLPWMSGLPGLRNMGVLPRFTGLVEHVAGDHIDVIVGAGVGGSTLVYGGMFPQPAGDLFSQVFPSGLDYEELDSIYYPRARARLGSGTVPADVLAHPRYASGRLLDEYASAAGLATERLQMNFDWDVVRAELAGQAVPSASVGEYVGTGCNSGAKLSVDRTYLARAERSGHCTVKPLHEVTRITRDRRGRYIVSCDRISERGSVLESVTITAEALVLAAGAAHTPAMLTRARATGDLPHLDDQVGAGWGSNGDTWVLLKALPDNTGAPQGGPSTFFVRDNSDPAVPVGIVHGPSPLPLETRTMALMGMGVPDKYGTFTYSPLTGRSALRWDADSDAGAARAVLAAAKKIARASGGPFANAIDITALRRLTVHPLGGVVIGRATDLYGRINGYPNLYCLDASLMPGSTAAVNPALTIAAVIERCLDHLIPTDFTAP